MLFADPVAFLQVSSAQFARTEHGLHGHWPLLRVFNTCMDVNFDNGIRANSAHISPILFNDSECEHFRWRRLIFGTFLVDEQQIEIHVCFQCFSNDTNFFPRLLQKLRRRNIGFPNTSKADESTVIRERSQDQIKKNRKWLRCGSNSIAFWIQRPELGLTISYRSLRISMAC